MDSALTSLLLSSWKSYDDLQESDCTMDIEVRVRQGLPPALCTRTLSHHWWSPPGQSGATIILALVTEYDNTVKTLIHGQPCLLCNSVSFGLQWPDVLAWSTTSYFSRPRVCSSSLKVHATPSVSVLQFIAIEGSEVLAKKALSVRHAWVCIL